MSRAFVLPPVSVEKYRYLGIIDQYTFQMKLCRMCKKGVTKLQRVQTSGMIEPRYWFCTGCTYAEREAHQTVNEREATR